MPGALRAPRAWKRVRFQEHHVVRAFQLREPVRGGFVGEGADTGLAYFC